MPTPMTVVLPLMHPAKCINCGCGHNKDGRRYIDLGSSVPIYGAIYFCEHCLKEAIKSLDDNERTPEDISVLVQLNAKIQKLEDENGRLRRALADFDFLGVHSRTVDSSSADDEESESNDDSSVQGTPSGVQGTERGPAKQSDVEGPVSVRNDDPFAGLGKSSSTTV